jgi:hypothetical protein
MVKLYEIWYSGSSATVPMTDLISVFPFYRDDVISKDLSKLNRTLERLKTCYEDDTTSFGIREKHYEHP